MSCGTMSCINYTAIITDTVSVREKDTESEIYIYTYIYIYIYIYIDRYTKFLSIFHVFGINTYTTLDVSLVLLDKLREIDSCLKKKIVVMTTNHVS